jgi:hypothetical protein
MPKICKHEECNHPVFGGGYCRNHQFLRTDKKPKERDVGRTPIKKVSAKRQREAKIYSDTRETFLREQGLCGARIANICTKIATQIHHKQGRSGRHNCPVAA